VSVNEEALSWVPNWSPCPPVLERVLKELNGETGCLAGFCLVGKAEVEPWNYNKCCEILATLSGCRVDLDELSSVKRRRIWFIEDDPEASFLLKRILILGGFDVANAMTGKDGMKKKSRSNQIWILLDLRMPEIDGWETYQRLRKVTSIPVIVVSADNSKDDIVRALQEGVDD